MGGMPVETGPEDFAPNPVLNQNAVPAAAAQTATAMMPALNMEASDIEVYDRMSCLRRRIVQASGRRSPLRMLGLWCSWRPGSERRYGRNEQLMSLTPRCVFAGNIRTLQFDHV
jgi:hypothetical protein